MKKHFLLWLLILAGCQPSIPDPVVSAPKEVKTVVGGPKPSAESPKSEETKTSSSQPAQNPKRLYQLSSLKRTQVEIEGKSLPVWVMDDEAKRQEGMMWLTNGEVKDQEGMLFVFPKPQPLSFWMQNTVLPLDIAYIAANGKVINVVQGKPFDETSLPSKAVGQFVIEVKQGQAKKLGLVAGAQVNIKAEDRKGN